ncbi:hypothetical protein GCM10008019_27290 [Deinococcus soli (ex Cha et al. 2016)]|nr:hypothetical protein GCM10008019_27290 [Deinococcus soli (ex Cha et al. 2016)]
MLAAGASANLDLANATPALIRKLAGSASLRAALYASAADRTADASRLDTTPTTAPTSASPITQATTSGAAPVAIGEAAQGDLYARVVNLSGAAAALTLTLTLEDA